MAIDALYARPSEKHIQRSTTVMPKAPKQPAGPAFDAIPADELAALAAKAARGPHINSALSVSASMSPLLIRGDTTFLREDFALNLPISLAPDVPPVAMRFDFLVRTREATKDDHTLLRTALADTRSYPQRDAVLFALRELTGKDAGPTTLAWQKLFPQAEEQAEAGRLLRKLLKSNPLDQQGQLIVLRDGKRLACTLTLANAIPSLSGALKQKARDFLTDRLEKFTAGALRDRLGDDNLEMRLAAIRACGSARRTEMVPDLNRLLTSKDPSTVRQAHTSLKEIRGN
jgi:hypothetical protein